MTDLSLDELRKQTWFRILLHALPVYLMSRLFVIVGAAVVASELGVDRNLSDERGIEVADPHLLTAAVSPVRAAADVLTSWDGLWYMSIVRDGYPTVVAPDVTYHVSDARAAFFPLFPMLARFFDAVLPGGDTVAVLFVNAILGLIVVVLVAMIAERLYGEQVGRTTAILVAMFPGSFVLSFAYSEPLMIRARRRHVMLLSARPPSGYAAGRARGPRHRHPTERIGARRSPASSPPVSGDPRATATGSALSAVLIAPLGFIAFQVWLGRAHRRSPPSGSGSSARPGARGPASDGPPSRTPPRQRRLAAHLADRHAHGRAAWSPPIVLLLLSGWKAQACPGCMTDVLVGDRRPDAAPRHRHGPAPVPVHRLPAADRRRRVGTSSAATPTTTSGLTRWPQAVPDWRP